MSRQIVMRGARQPCRGASNASLRTPARRVAILFAVVGSASGCTTSALRPSNQTEFGSSTRQDLIPLTSTRAPSAEPGRVRADELRSTGVFSLRDALTRVRPQFLRANIVPGTPNVMATPSIYVNGRYTGALDVLQLVQVAEVSEVRYLRPTIARLTYGAGCACGGGVIDVTTHSAP
jgi:hypothetical protein